MHKVGFLYVHGQIEIADRHVFQERDTVRAAVRRLILARARNPQRVISRLADLDELPHSVGRIWVGGLPTVHTVLEILVHQDGQLGIGGTQRPNGNYQSTYNDHGEPNENSHDAPASTDRLGIATVLNEVKSGSLRKDCVRLREKSQPTASS
jgi:hypothetical protein